MSRRKVLISMLALFLLAVLALPALAQQEKVDIYENQKLVKSVVFVVGTREYFVNGQTPGVKMDVAPFVEQGRTFVPVRFLSNALGVEDRNIGWNEKTRLVTLKQPGFPVVELTVGKKQIKSDGQARDMDVSPLVRSGRTFLPARWVAEALGYQVDWDASLGLVVCWPRGEEKPDLSAVKQYLNEQKPEEPQVPGINKPVVDLKGQGEVMEGFYNYSALDPNQKIVYVTMDDIKANAYDMSGGVKANIVKDVRITKDKIYIDWYSTAGVAFGVLLAEGKLLRYRDPDWAFYGKQNFTAQYSVVDDLRDKYSNLPTADITKVTHIIIEGQTYLAIENPLYAGKK
ncbi:copper amine oxidase-like domain-containing protein [Desulfofundulus kuznetsovii DSM 6115]|uniref:Copper amine oxidase-like domain-containing protein n=1 Tax=Desulfofundulus kuznetsovii (strain DSM 6115 / VKM B-1805 / 17) TaxID=760568 RepID=A0AAU8PCS8_DESK7|nr:copper amine oxidase-like domain-containing protein [Desulfofundulus kuznetsovii DSM 6115]